MSGLAARIIEPKFRLEESRKPFSNHDIQKMIVPLLLEQLLVMLVGVADTFMVSFAGDAAVSGVSLVNMFNTVFIYLFMALAAGGAVIVSQYIGSRNNDLANTAAGQLLLISTVISIFFLVICLIWKEQMLRLMFGRVEADVMDACVLYLQISAYSFPALAVYNAGAALCRSMGKTSITMYVSVVSNMINIVGNAIGIFVLHAGVAGVAYPSLISRVFSAIVITAVCFSAEHSVKYRIQDILRWDSGMLRKILNVAVPNGVENGVFQLIKVALSSITALFGTVQIAANGVAQSFWSLAALAGVAMGPAFITVVGQCAGAGDMEAADYYFKKLTRITLMASVAWNGLILVLTPGCLLFFALSEEAKRLTILLVLIHNICNAVLFPYSGAMPNGLRAAGDVRFTMIISLLSTVFCRLLLSVVMGIWWSWGVVGITIAMCCDWGLRLILYVGRYKSGKWKQFKIV